MYKNRICYEASHPKILADENTTTCIEMSIRNVKSTYSFFFSLRNLATVGNKILLLYA